MSGSRLDVADLVQDLFLILGSQEETAAQSSSHPDSSMGTLDGLENKLYLAVAEARRLKNGFASINRLPPEILSEVFDNLQFQVTHNQQRSPYPVPLSQFTAWTVVTRVCHFWREVAMSTPSLWDRIQLGDRDRVDIISQMAIKHSSMMPLTIHYSPENVAVATYPREDRNRPMQLINDQAYRLQELHLDHTKEYMSPSLRSESWEILDSPCPRLEVLSIIGSHYSRRILPRLFADFTPRLRKLTLSAISSWPWNHFHGLTHLRLFHQTDPAMEEFMDILRASPELEELVLVEAGPDLRLHDLPDRTLLPPPISLPCLKRLGLGDWSTAESVAFFMSHLTLPEPAALTYSVWGGPLSGFLSHLLNITPDGQLPNIWRVAILIKDDLSRSMAIKDGTLYIAGEVYSHQYLSLFTDNLLPAVKEFIICTSDEVNSASLLETSEMKQIMASMPSLETITLSGYTAPNFHRFVADALGLMDDTDETTVVPVPLLRKLAVYTYPLKDSTTEYEAIDPLPIVLLMIHRSNIGYPINALEVENLSGTNQLLLLQKRCPDVCWLHRRKGISAMFEDELVRELTELVEEVAAGLHR